MNFLTRIWWSARTWGTLGLLCALGLSVGVASGQTATCVVAPAGMIAWWPLDEQAGTTVTDIVGGHDGTIAGPGGGPIGGTGPVPISGSYVGNSLQFDFGIWADVPSTSDLNFGTGAFTIDAWVKYTQSPAGGADSIVHKRDVSGGGSGYVLRLATPFPGNQQRLQLIIGNTAYQGPIITAPVGTWFFVAAVRIGNTVTLYVNNVSTVATSVATPSASSIGPLRIGFDSNVGKLAIDELEIYDRALTPLEIQGLFNAGTAGKCRPCDEQADVVIDLTTGVGAPPNAPAPLAPGSADEKWKVTSVLSVEIAPVPAVVTVVPNPPQNQGGIQAWLTLPPSQWISTDINGNNPAPNGDYVYESCFCLNDAFENPLFTFLMRADDEADVHLNDDLIFSTPPCNFFQPPFVCSFNAPSPTGSSYSGSAFKGGENCVRVRVHNRFGVVTGFSLTGKVTADNAQCCPTMRSPAEVWIGLKNGDDVGLKVDLLAEVFKNGVPVGSGQLNDVPTGSSGFKNAVLRTIAMTLSSTPAISLADTLSFRLSARVAATGHRSGTVKLWYNGAASDTGSTRDSGSHFEATIGTTTGNQYLRTGAALSTTAGQARTFVDVFVDRGVGGNPFKPLGTWRTVRPAPTASSCAGRPDTCSASEQP